MDRLSKPILVSQEYSAENHPSVGTEHSFSMVRIFNSTRKTEEFNYKQNTGQTSLDKTATYMESAVSFSGISLFMPLPWHLGLSSDPTVPTPCLVLPHPRGSGSLTVPHLLSPNPNLFSAPFPEDPTVYMRKLIINTLIHATVLPSLLSQCVAFLDKTISVLPGHFKHNALTQRGI